MTDDSYIMKVKGSKEEIVMNKRKNKEICQTTSLSAS